MAKAIFIDLNKKANDAARQRTLELVERTRKTPELKKYTTAQITGLIHKSKVDRRDHATVRLATDSQAAAERACIAHIYADGEDPAFVFYPARHEEMEYQP